MDLYNDVSYQISRLLTLRYSSSFGLSSKLFAKPVRKHIYAIYGLVRIADEIVDTYQGVAAKDALDELETELCTAVKRNYSTNPIIQSFVVTVKEFDISWSLITPFFDSMRMDLQPMTYSKKDYDKYIYGSAEVVGLLCLKVFTLNDKTMYNNLEHGARALGSAFQKVNFLRDIQNDYTVRKRFYFPGYSYDTFDDTAKQAVAADIYSDFKTATKALHTLPRSSKKAVSLSYAYYSKLLKKLDAATLSTIKSERVRLNSFYKLWLLAKILISGVFIR
ncbi:phytoene/squalene synthase family protein [bacterium]|nr:phytoene/squalene synthase family protein [bacterium]NBX98420.1 phytoene/squalene synthase family protein [bacterium]NDC94362.1 phytoene/squalene synthase family protein [bacterium]NDD83834.1 phytoene/squalene synthase family protein [bacterium]NDG29677.1 phytoene/squalene synthase family protein [bacterium]